MVSGQSTCGLSKFMVHMTMYMHAMNVWQAKCDFEFTHECRKSSEGVHSINLINEVFLN